MTAITFKPIETFRTDDHKANLATAAKISASLKDDYAERDKLKAAIDRNEKSDLTPELRIQALAEGRSLPVPATLEARLHELQVKIRDKNDALDFLASKAKFLEIEAQKKLLDNAKPQIVAAEKAMWGAFETLFEKVVPVFTAKRHLHGHGVRTYELFANSFDEFLGIPVDLNSPFCELFREGIAAGYISKMPAVLRPKA